MNNHTPPTEIGTCDWCKKENIRLQPRRDIDEGAAGPVYDVCAACASKDEKALQAELDEYESSNAPTFEPIIDDDTTEPFPEE